MPLPRFSRRTCLLVVLLSASAAVGVMLPDLVILHPPHCAMASTGAERRRISSRDGALEIWTARSRPHAAPGSKADVYVLRFYGNADQADPNVGNEVAGWAERDTVIWGVNYPGYGGSSGHARLSSTGPAALAAYDALRAEAGPERPILVFGTSFGATAALCVAARHPEVAGVVVQNPPPFREMILRGWGWWNLWLVAGPALAAVPRDLESVPNARACRMRGVCLLADRDEVVAPKYARLVADAYAGEKRIIPLPGGHHNSPLDEAQTRELHRDVAWLLERAGSR